MKKISHTLTCILLVLFASRMNAQISGVVTVPGTYASIAAVINTLNTSGVSGAVTVNIAAGYTETAPAGGYVLNTIAGASAANTIVFQKSGAGANPLITASTGGFNTPASVTQDGVWNFVGTDWVTVDGINITDPNTTNPQTMEYGFGLFKASGTNGCQNNTIKNCVITLNRVNNASGSNPSLEGSRGINMVNALMTNQTSGLTVYSAAGANSNNKFYSNTVQNCNVCIAFYGYQDSSPFALADTGNDLGGTSAATGNTLINFGGGGNTTSASAVLLAYQYSINASYNTINNNNGAGINHTADMRGIFLLNGNNVTATISNNTITLQGGGTTAAVQGIINSAGTSGTTNTITISNNLITGCTQANATSGNFTGIQNTTSAANVIISGNTFTNNSSNTTSGTVYLINNSGSVPGVIAISNNNLSYNFSNPTTGYSGTHYVIYNNGAVTASSSLSVSGNTFSNWVNAANASNSTYYIYNSVSVRVNNLVGNSWNNLSIRTSGGQYFMYNSSNTQFALNVSNNSITNYTRTLASGDFYGYYCSGSSLGSSTQTITGNNFSNITSTVSGTGTFYGFYSSDGSSSPYPQKTVFNNSLSNITYNTTGTAYMMYVNYLGDGGLPSGSSVFSNTITNITSNSASQIGLYTNSTASPNYPPSVYSNIAQNMTSSNPTALNYGHYINQTQVLGMRYYKNKISDISATGAGGTAAGLFINAATNGLFYNNVIANITAPNSSANVYGIVVNGGVSANLFYNSVYLNASSTVSGFSSYGIIASNAPNLTLMNNIFVNNSIATGSGIAAAYRRGSVGFSTYMSNSNNNVFYAGVPSANNLIFSDGTNNIQSLGAYKTFVGNRDQASVTENVPFLSTVATSTNFLRVSPTLPTVIESAGSPALIVGSPVIVVTDDYAGTARNVTTPDIGAFESTYTPYSSCSGTPAAVSAITSNSALCTNATAVVALPVTYTATGLNYQWQQSVAGQAGPYLTIPSATNTAYSAVVGTQNIWYRAIVSCSTAGSTTSTPVQVIVSPAVSPTAVASVVNLCSGQNSTLSLNGATGPAGLAYQWQISTTGAAGPYSPVAGATLTTLTATNITSNVWYQAIVSCSAFPTASVASVPAQVNSNSLAITPTAAAASTTICPNATSALTLTGNTGSGLVYQWQASTTGSNVGYSAISNATTVAYTATLGAGTTWYQAVVSCSANASTSVLSTPVMVVAGIAASITPVATTSSFVVCPTSTISLGVTGTITGLSYQWQSSTTGSNTGYAAIANATTSPFTPSVGATTWYQSVVSCSANAAFSVASSPVLVSVGGTVIPTSTAASNTICPGSTSVLNLTVPVSSVIPSSGLSYQWMASTTGSAGAYSSVANATTAPYTATVGATTWYQAVISCTANTSYSVTSTPVVVNIGSPSITPVTSVSNPNICGGGVAALSLLNASAPTGTLIQWQTASIAAGPYSPAAGTSTNSTYNATVTTSGWYQAVISCSANSVYSVVSSPLLINASLPLINPVATAATSTACANVTSALSLNNTSGVSGTVIYQWLSSTTGSNTGYANAVGTSTTSGYTATVTTTNTWYQAVISCSTSPTSSVLSSPVLVTSGLAFATATTAAASTTLCPGLTDALTLTGTSGSGLAYQWYASPTGGSGSYTAVPTFTNSSYTPTISANTWFQAVISCSANASTSVASTPIAVVSSIPAYNAAATSTILCPGNTTDLSLVGASTSGLAYQWQASTTNSTTGYSAIGSATNAAYTATVPATTWYQAVINCTSNPSGTVTSAPILVSSGVPVASSVTAISNTSITCKSNAVGLSLSAAAGASVTYQWMASSTGSASGYSPIANATLSTLSNTTGAAGNNWYAAVISCSAAPSVSIMSAPVTVTLAATPSASIAISNTSICQPGTVTLNGSSDIGFAYTWRGPATGPVPFISYNQNNSLTNPAAGIYTLTVANGTCVSSPVTVTLVVNNILVAGISSPSTILCPGQTTTLQTTLPTGAVNTYSFIPSTGVSLVTMGAGSVSISGPGNDDANSSVLPIGFNFNFNNAEYSQFVVSPNGWIGLGTGPWNDEWNNATYPDAFNTANQNANLPRISPYYDDQATGSTAGGGYTRSQLMGAFPTRSLVVEWFTRIPWSTSSAANSRYQAILYEGSNAIEFRYSTMGSDNGGLSTCGLEGNTTYGPFISVTFSNNTANTTTVINTNTAQPASGTSYLFNPQTLAGFTYTWAPASSVSSTSGSTVTSTPATSTTYSVNYSYQGCSATRTLGVIVGTTPTINIVASATALCSGASASLTANGAATYSWINTGSTNTTIVVSPLASTTIYTVSGAIGTCGSSTQTIAVGPSTSSITLSGSSGICTGQTATISASGATSYTWSSGATTSSITDAPTTNGTFTYGVSGTDANGCIIGASQVLNVANGLNIGISSASVSCSGQTLNLVGSGGVTYTWSVANATTSSIVDSPTTTTTYSLIGASGTCSNIAIKTVTVNANPTLTVSANATICAGSSTTLTAIGAATYSWSANATGTNVVVSPTNSITYSVTGTSTAFCTDTKTISVFTNTLPIIGIAQTATAACAQVPITFTASGANTYSWTGGPNTAINTVTPSTSGNNIYTVTATNAALCVSSKTVGLTTYSLPIVAVTPAAPTICSTSSVQLTAAGAPTLSWSGGPLTSSYVVTPTNSTTYSVTGTTTDNCVFTATVAVTTNSLPIVTVAQSAGTVCSQAAVTLTNSGASTYSIVNLGVTVPSLTTVFPSSNTTYTVVGITAQGCVKAATIAVSTLSLPVIVVSPALTTVCVNAPKTFTATGATTYTWNNTTTTGSTAVLTSTGLTSYGITGTGANGCNGSGSFIVFTNPLPVVSVSASDATVCSTSPVSFSATGADTYTWSTSTSSDVITVNPVNATTYTVNGTNTITGCVGTQTISVVTNSLPVVTISPASPTVCFKSALTLAGSGADTYQWSTGSSNQSINLTPSVSVTYTLTGTDLLGCSKATTVAVSINQLPTIVAASKSICLNEVATFTASGANTYTWAPNNATGATYTVQPGLSAQYSYTVSGTDANNCVNKTTVNLDVNDCVGFKTNSISSNVVSVFPNPSNGVFTATFNFSGEKTVMITNSVGQVISQTITSNTSEVFNLSEMAKGVYFVKVSSKEASGNYKIVIE